MKRKPILSAGFLFLFAALFLSSLPAFIAVFWLIPEYVLIQSFFWVILAAIAMWKLRKIKLPTIKSIVGETWFIFPFTIYSGLTLFWSVYWEITLLRWVVLLCTIITSLYIGVCFHPRKIVGHLSVFGIYILFSSMFLITFVPDVGVMHYYSIHGAWKGLFWHKNHMGLIGAFINIVFLLRAIEAYMLKKTSSFFWGLLYVLALIFIFFTDSVASYFTIIGLHGVLIIAYLYSRFQSKLRPYHIVIFLIAAILVASLVLINASSILSIFNRNTSLTGRIPMWSFLFDAYIKMKPLEGYGLTAFWFIEAHQLTMQKAAGYPDPIIIADNGFIDILVNTGFCGLALFLLLYLGIWWRSILYAKTSKNIMDFFPIILLSFIFIANISWSLIFENESLFLILMVAILYSIIFHTSTLPIHDLSKEIGKPDLS